MKMDLHIHTRYSRTKRWGSASLIEPRQLLDIAAELGLDGLAVTDHDEIDGSLIVAELAPAWGLVAVPGIEVSTTAGHILGLGVTRRIPRGLHPADVIDLIHEQGGIAVAAHPLNVVVSLRKKQILELPLDALETHNARSFRNRKTARLRADLLLGQTGGSDAHSIAEIGRGLTETRMRLTSYREVIDAIRKGKTFAHGTRTHYRQVARACIDTVARQKKESLKRRILVGLSMYAA